MDTNDAIRKHGFRKWYERRLIEGHAWLVTMLLSILATAGAFEALSSRGSAADYVFDLAVIVSGAALAGWSWHRYAAAMILAEHVGHQASCPGCQRYGFKPLPRAETGEGAARGSHLVASCRQCGHRWPIDPRV